MTSIIRLGWGTYDNEHKERNQWLNWECRTTQAIVNDDSTGETPSPVQQNSVRWTKNGKNLIYLKNEEQSIHEFTENWVFWRIILTLNRTSMKIWGEDDKPNSIID